MRRCAGQWIEGLRIISNEDFETFDQLHYEVENKLLRLIESLESKRTTNNWLSDLPQPINPIIHQSNNPPCL